LIKLTKTVLNSSRKAFGKHFKPVCYTIVESTGTNCLVINIHFYFVVHISHKLSCTWTSESDQTLRASSTRRLKGDEVMQIRRLGG